MQHFEPFFTRQTVLVRVVSRKLLLTSHMLDNVTITSLVTCDCWSTESGYRGLSDVSFGRVP